MSDFTEEVENITILQFILRIIQTSTTKSSFWELKLSELYSRFQREILMSLQLKGQVLRNWYVIINRLQPEYFIITNNVLKITINQLCTHIRDKLVQYTTDPEEYLILEKIFVDIGCTPSERIYEPII